MGAMTSGPDASTIGHVDLDQSCPLSLIHSTKLVQHACERGFRGSVCGTAGKGHLQKERTARCCACPLKCSELWVSAVSHPSRQNPC